MKSLPKEGALSTERSKPKREAVCATDHRARSDQTNSSPDNVPSTLDAGCAFGFGLSRALIPSFLAVLPLLSFIMGCSLHVFVCWKYATS